MWTRSLATEHVSLGCVRFVLAVLIVLATAAPAAADHATAFLVEPDAVPTHRQPEIAVTFSVGVKGDVTSGLGRFRDVAHATLNDPRGWGGPHEVAFVEERRAADIRLWLASPDVVDAAAPLCDATFSCRVGDDVYINAMRWERATSTYRDRSLAEYRQYVVNHEVGHWFGLDHPVCRGNGESAPVMLQQSKDLQGCEARVWPLSSERRQALDGLADR